jgi:hypothetical protein
MYSSTLSLTSALDEGGWSTPRPGRFTPGNNTVLIVQEAGWAPGPVWTGAENLTLTGIRSPDRPARSSVAIPTELPRPTFCTQTNLIYLQLSEYNYLYCLVLIPKYVSETGTTFRHKILQILTTD